MKPLQIIILVVLSTIAVTWMSVAHSADWLDIHLASKHSEEGFNETNPGIGWSHVIKRNHDFIAGMYHNSYSRTTVYVGGDYHTSNEVFNVGVSYGFVTGYEETPVMVLPNASVTINHFRIKIGWIPSPDIQALTLSAGVMF